MQRKLVIFDFDGTLADTFELFLRGFDEAAALHRFSPFDRERMGYLRSLSAREILLYHNVPLWKIPLAARVMRRTMLENIDNVRLFPKITEMIESLDANGATLALLTSNATANVAYVMGDDLFRRFAYVESGTSLFGKRARLKKLLAASGFAAADAIYIGDELRDLEAATACSVAFGAVAWGYSNLDALMKAGSQIAFARPEQLASLLVADTPSVICGK